MAEVVSNSLGTETPAGEDLAARTFAIETLAADDHMNATSMVDGS